MINYRSRRLRQYFRKSMWIFVTWFLINTAIFFLEYFSLASNEYLASDYDLTAAFAANTVASVVAGLVGGFITLHVMEYWLRKYAFWKALLLIIVAFTIAAFVVSVIAASYAISNENNLSTFHPDVMEQVVNFFSTWRFVKNYIIWLFIVVGTLIVLMVSDKYGPGVFGDYLLGRYFQPKKEHRIFMFADIKDATTIAESLGERKYFNLLKDFFRDIAPAVVETRGEVYQYVGDEVVISWKLKHGLKNGNAIRCFLIMKELIAEKASRYNEKYGLSPQFKVGYHFGPVMVGELGQIKRDIAFSGDVLNTTARIQAKCNEYGVDNLSSKEFSEVVKELPPELEIREMGRIQLKGKKAETALVTFSKVS